MESFDETPVEIDALISNAKQGDAKALGRLFTIHRKYLIFLARAQLHHHLQSKADPSDIAQDVCMKAHEHIGEFRGQSDAEFAGWLRAILANVLAMHIRNYLGTKKRDVHMEQSLTNLRCHDQTAAHIASGNDSARRGRRRDDRRAWTTPTAGAHRCGRCQ